MITYAILPLCFNYDSTVILTGCKRRWMGGYLRSICFLYLTVNIQSSLHVGVILDHL